MKLYWFCFQNLQNIDIFIGLRGESEVYSKKENAPDWGRFLFVGCCGQFRCTLMLLTDCAMMPCPTGVR